MEQDKQNFLDKKEFLKSLIYEALRLDNEVRIRKIVRRLCEKDSTRVSLYRNCDLSSDELVVDHILKQCKISPRTAYRWFSLSRAPKEVLELVQNGKISMNEAQRLCAKVKKNDPETEKLGWEIMEKVAKITRGM